MSVKERLKTFIENQKLTVSAFEKSINASNGYVNSISKSIGLDKLETILEKYPNIDLKWLLSGKATEAPSQQDLLLESHLAILKEANAEYKTPNSNELLKLAVKFIANKEELKNFKIIKDDLEIDVLKRIIEIKEQFGSIEEYLTQKI